MPNYFLCILPYQIFEPIYKANNLSRLFSKINIRFSFLKKSLYLIPPIYAPTSILKNNRTYSIYISSKKNFRDNYNKLPNNNFSELISPKSYFFRSFALRDASTVRCKQIFNQHKQKHIVPSSNSLTNYVTF